jgi:hypothetical protein
VPLGQEGAEWRSGKIGIPTDDPPGVSHYARWKSKPELRARQ